MSSEIHRRLFTVDDCQRMVEAGILGRSERIELIHGDILQMTPIGPRHGAAVDRINRAMARVLGDSAIIRVQGTVELDPFCAPEPDIVLLRPRNDFYKERNPAVPDIFLIIEVADSSLDYDSTVKKELYAILGIPEYWILDLRNLRLLVHTEPSEDAYQVARELYLPDIIAPSLLPNCRISLADILP